MLNQYHYNVLNALDQIESRLKRRYRNLTGDDLDFSVDSVYEAFAQIGILRKHVYKSAIHEKLSKRSESKKVTLLEYVKGYNESPISIAEKFNLTIDELALANGDSYENLYNNDTIKIPIMTTGEISGQTNEIPVLTDQGGEALLGSDITRLFSLVEVQNPNDEENPFYDLDTVSGTANLQQGIAHLLRTKQGDNVKDPSFGILSSNIGFSNELTELRETLSILSIENAVLKDKRVADIVRTKATGVSFDIELIPVSAGVLKYSPANETFSSDPNRIYDLPTLPVLIAPNIDFTDDDMTSGIFESEHSEANP